MTVFVSMGRAFTVPSPALKPAKEANRTYSILFRSAASATLRQEVKIRARSWSEANEVARTFVNSMVWHVKEVR